MAFGATPVYVASWDHGTPEPLQVMMNEEVDVVNMSFGPGPANPYQQHPGVCNPMYSTTIQTALEDAFDQGIFLVNSTGNFSAAYTGKTKDDCLTNPHATLPRVFAVAGILNRTYEYGSFSGYWEAGYTSTLYPSSPDDYWNMRVNPEGSQTGGADLKINGTTYSRAMTVVDLVAPEGGYNTTHSDGANGNLGEFFGGSSGAAPHVSGLAMLVKHHFLQNNVPLMNYPGWLHTVMLAMGDRGFWNTTNLVMQKKSFGGDRVYGFGKVKLRRPLPGNFRMMNKTWTSSNFPTGYYAERIWPYPSTSSHKFVKGVMNQIERMQGKSANDMVSDLWIRLAQTDQTYSGMCPSSFETACVQAGSCIYASDNSRDVKKMVQQFASGGMAGKCHYIQIYKRHITSSGASVQLFFYRSNLSDHENSD